MSLVFLSDLVRTWQFNIIALLVITVVFVQYYKLSVVGAKQDGAVLVVLQCIGGMSILVLMPFYPITFATDPGTYLLLLAAVVLYALNDRIQTTVRRHLDVSLFSILNQFSKVFLVLYGIFLFHQQIVSRRLVGGVLILLSIAALFYRRGKIHLNRHVLLSLLAELVIATAITIDVDISTQFNLPAYIMITLVLPALLVFSVERLKVAEIVEEFQSDRKAYHLVTGVSWGLLILFTIRSLQLGEAVFIAPLMAVSVPLNVVVASILHHEKDHMLRKIIVSFVIILGIYLTVV
ncbi:MAG: hypothetical protein HGA38_01975 [Candidatus Moranbacteria bacterium]|nr:hypothetical protein [Candidatus Moranbacteria bacterium]